MKVYVDTPSPEYVDSVRRLVKRQSAYGLARTLCAGGLRAAFVMFAWGWFVVPLGLPDVSYLHACGLLLLVEGTSSLNNDRQDALEQQALDQVFLPEPARKDLREAERIVMAGRLRQLFAVIYPAFLLACALAVRALMTGLT